MRDTNFYKAYRSALDEVLGDKNITVPMTAEYFPSREKMDEMFGTENFYEAILPEVLLYLAYRCSSSSIDEITEEKFKEYGNRREKSGTEKRAFNDYKSSIKNHYHSIFLRFPMMPHCIRVFQFTDSRTSVNKNNPFLVTAQDNFFSLKDLNDYRDKIAGNLSSYKPTNRKKSRLDEFIDKYYMEFVFGFDYINFLAEILHEAGNVPVEKYIVHKSCKETETKLLPTETQVLSQKKLSDIVSEIKERIFSNNQFIHPTDGKFTSLKPSDFSCIAMSLNEKERNLFEKYLDVCETGTPSGKSRSVLGYLLFYCLYYNTIVTELLSYVSTEIISCPSTTVPFINHS